jgi:SAM-dependent methyltransferase
MNQVCFAPRAVPDDARMWSAIFDDLYLRTYGALADPETGPKQAEGLVRLVGLGPGADLLDCPCGYGRHSVEFARLGHHVVGADWSEFPAVFCPTPSKCRRSDAFLMTSPNPARI